MNYVGKGNSPKASKAIYPAKSFLDYRLSPLKSPLYETYIQININRRIYIGRGEKVYMHKSHIQLSSI